MLQHFDKYAPTRSGRKLDEGWEAFIKLQLAAS